MPLDESNNNDLETEETAYAISEPIRTTQGPQAGEHEHKHTLAHTRRRITSLRSLCFLRINQQ